MLGTPQILNKNLARVCPAVGESLDSQRLHCSPLLAPPRPRSTRFPFVQPVQCPLGMRRAYVPDSSPSLVHRSTHSTRADGVMSLTLTSSGPTCLPKSPSLSQALSTVQLAPESIRSLPVASWSLCWRLALDSGWMCSQVAQVRLVGPGFLVPDAETAGHQPLSRSYWSESTCMHPTVERGRKNAGTHL